MSRARHSIIRPTILATGLALLYNNWLLAPILNPHLSTARSLISEISATSQPFHQVFQTGDIIAGLISLAMVPFVWRLVRVHDLAWHGVLAISIAVIGADSIIDASLPISCAPSTDAHCQLLNLHSWVTMAHLTESNIAGVLIFLAPLTWWWFARRKHRRLAQASLLLAGLELATGISILVTRAFGIHIEGLLQRGYELAIGGWIGYLVALSLRHWLDKSFVIEE